jgi:hypothetical protein
MTNENDMMMKEKLDFYMNKKIMVHLELKDKQFLNARIIEVDKDNSNVYIINERVFGLMHIFVGEVWRVTEFQEGKK